MSSTNLTKSAQKIVNLLQKLPADHVKHFASLKFTQIERFCNIGGIPIPKSVQEEQLIEQKKQQKLIKIDTKKLKRMVFAEKDEAPNYQREIFDDEILTQQYISLKNIGDNKWSKFYPIGDKLLQPKGNPNYYTRLMGDVEKGGQTRESIFDAFKTILTGKY
ncbi:unnamed protein product [Ambrosiozyma monospora]|uniref:Unnamed protein product n=1 Tax=Ambrosiozyma monospora TaxID=43982 RepID=A0A9W6YTH8_AMBMO|nr:unnamed protein product [Ambrosiozyma monospora]